MSNTTGIYYDSYRTWLTLCTVLLPDVCVCVRACMRVYVHACVRTCVRAWGNAVVHACMYVFINADRRTHLESSHTPRRYRTDSATGGTGDSQWCHTFTCTWILKTKPGNFTLVPLTNKFCRMFCVSFGRYSLKISTLTVTLTTRTAITNWHKTCRPVMMHRYTILLCLVATCWWCTTIPYCHVWLQNVPKFRRYGMDIFWGFELAVWPWPWGQALKLFARYS